MEQTPTRLVMEKKALFSRLKHMQLHCFAELRKRKKYFEKSWHGTKIFNEMPYLGIFHALASYRLYYRLKVAFINEICKAWFCSEAHNSPSSQNLQNFHCWKLRNLFEKGSQNLTFIVSDYYTNSSLIKFPEHSNIIIRLHQSHDKRMPLPRNNL